MYPKNCPLKNRLFTAMTPSFCSLTDIKQSLQYTIKTHLSSPPGPPSSTVKQCNKSATVKISYGTTFDLLRPGNNLAVVRHIICDR